MLPSDFEKLGTVSEQRLDVPAAVYHASKGVSNSVLQKIYPTPAHLKAYLDNRESEDDGEEIPEHFMIGTLVHQTILEPEKEWPSVVVKPSDVRYNTASGKAWKAEQLAAGKTIFTRTAYETLVGCVTSLAKHRFMQMVMRSGQPEVSAWWVRPDVVLRSRFDWVPGGIANYLMDIKTVRSAAPKEFQRAAWNFGWFQKAAFYLDIYNATRGLRSERSEFLYVAVEKTPPYCVALYRVSQHSLEWGRGQYEMDLLTYNKCVETGEWPGYPDNVQTLDLPPWGFNKGQQP